MDTGHVLYLISGYCINSLATVPLYLHDTGRVITKQAQETKLSCSDNATATISFLSFVDRRCYSTVGLPCRNISETAHRVASRGLSFTLAEPTGPTTADCVIFSVAQFFSSVLLGCIYSVPLFRHKKTAERCQHIVPSRKRMTAFWVDFRSVRRKDRHQVLWWPAKRKYLQMVIALDVIYGETWLEEGFGFIKVQNYQASIQRLAPSV